MKRVSVGTYGLLLPAVLALGFESRVHAEEAEQQTVLVEAEESSNHSTLKTTDQVVVERVTPSRSDSLEEGLSPSSSVKKPLEQEQSVEKPYIPVAATNNVRPYIPMAATNNGVLPEKTATLSIEVEALTDNRYAVYLSGVPNSVEQLLVPITDEDNATLNPVWYRATKEADGRYRVDMDLSYHSRGSKMYHLTSLGQEGDGRLLTFLGNAFSLPEPPKLVPIELLVTELEKNKYRLEVQNVSEDIVAVQVPIWSDVNGQDDIKWYETSKDVNGHFTTVIDARHHHYRNGLYHIHVYVKTRNGELKGLLGTTKPFTNNLRPATGSASQGNYDVFHRRVFLDAGHGGSDPGAVYGGYTEKALNLSIQNQVKALLENEGISVELSRTRDSSLGLLDRSKKVNATKSDIFVSIHFNASTSPSATGIETYYYQYYPDYYPQINQRYHNHSERLSKSADLAKSIQGALIAETGAKSNGVKRNTFAVLRETVAPAVLLELGFMSNDRERELIANPNYQMKLAKGIVEGIKGYYRIYEA